MLEVENTIDWPTYHDITNLHKVIGAGTSLSPKISSIWALRKSIKKYVNLAGKPARLFKSYTGKCYLPLVNISINYL